MKSKNPGRAALQRALDAAAKSEFDFDSGAVVATPKLQKLWGEFDGKVDDELYRWLQKRNLDENKLDQMQEADSTYNVYMTLTSGEGALWDGRWGHILTAAQVEDLEKYLRKKLGKYANDDTVEGGKIPEAMREVIYEHYSKAGVRKLKNKLLK